MIYVDKTFRSDIPVKNIVKWNKKIIYSNNTGIIEKRRKKKVFKKIYKLNNIIVWNNLLCVIIGNRIDLYYRNGSLINTFRCDSNLIDDVFLYNNHLICLASGYMYIFIYKKDHNGSDKFSIVRRIVKKIERTQSNMMLFQIGDSLDVYIDNKKKYVLEFKYNKYQNIESVTLEKVNDNNDKSMIKLNDKLFYNCTDKLLIYYKNLRMKIFDVIDISAIVDIKNIKIDIFKHNVIYVLYNCIYSLDNKILLKQNEYKITCLNVIDGKIYYGDENGNIYSDFDKTRENYKYLYDDHKITAYILKNFIVSDVIFEIFKFL